MLNVLTGKRRVLRDSAVLNKRVFTNHCHTMTYEELSTRLNKSLQMAFGGEQRQGCIT